ncbi:cilia- and flagella-associated protein 74-like [Sphaeramia orbicularis]|uniref:cilia- and flagella-associated protein 74-like n=1 Tax=Sphaeramia orbicularis TaxID=375764 RepID=UPI00117FDAD1|nr:cilia- and flagella-associated protein 74-like [Sphaeramia orbicularis]
MELKDRASPPGVWSVQGEPEGSSRACLFTEDTEDEVMLEDSVTDGGLATPPDLEWLEELYESDQGDDDGDGDLALAADTSNKTIYAETARMFKLRRNLDQLDRIHRQKEHDVLKARQELKLCLQNIEDLLELRENLEKEIEMQKAAEDSVAVFRLRAQHKCLCQELHSEEELEALIRTDLRQQELEFCEIEVELGRFSSLRQEVQEQEQTFQILKAQKAATRLQQERKVSQNLQHLRNKQTVTLRKDEGESQKKIEDGRMNRKKAAKFLKETIQRMHQQEAEKERQNKELLEKRMQAVKSLKANIAATQESLRIQQNRAKAGGRRTEQHQRQLREALQAQGVNAIKHLHRQKQREEIQRKQQEFEERQKSKRVEIVAKILQEEELLKRRKRQQSSKTTATDQFPPLGKSREKLQYYLQPRPPSTRSPPPPSDRALVSRRFSESSSDQWATSDPDEDQDEVPSEAAGGQSLVDSLEEPEFSGLWDQSYKKPVLTQTDVKQEGPTMTGGKLNVSAKKGCQKELKGPPFISKPEIILFKDFEVGKTYKKKIILTNISYVTNHCKLLTVSARLKDFISISFEPPGCLSPGMSCDLQAVFQPMINEDLEGELEFSSTTGPFCVPVKCSIKKCDLQVDSPFVDFGSHVVGQTISRTITLTNKGALATVFSLDTSESLPPEPHHVQMSPQDAAKCQEENGQNKPCDTQRSSASSLESAEVQPQQEDEEGVQPVEQQEEAAAGAEAVPEVLLTPDVDSHIDENALDSTSEIRLGNMREGEIGPFQSVKLEVIFTPTIPGEARLLFYIRFSGVNNEPIPIEVRGAAVSIPVWVSEPSMNLKICMFDRLYQDTVVVQSR